MGKRGTKPVNQNELAFWEKEWYRFFQGLAEGFKSVHLEEPDLTPRKLPDHPILLRELLRMPLRQRLRPARMLHRTIRSVLPERRLREELLHAETVRQVRAACKRSRYWQDRRRRKPPLPHAGFFFARLEDLYKDADEFLAAKRDSHCPRSARPSSEKKRLRYLARAMAGVTMDIRPRTALDLLEKKRSALRGEATHPGPQ